MASIVVAKSASEVINFDSICWDINKDKFIAKSTKIDRSVNAKLPGINGIEEIGNNIIVKENEKYKHYFVENKKPVPVPNGEINASKAKKRKLESAFNKKYKKMDGKENKTTGRVTR